MDAGPALPLEGVFSHSIPTPHLAVTPSFPLVLPCPDAMPHPACHPSTAGCTAKPCRDQQKEGDWVLERIRLSQGEVQGSLLCEMLLQCSKFQNPKPTGRLRPDRGSHLAKVTQVRRGRIAVHTRMEKESPKCGQGGWPVATAPASSGVSSAAV